MTARLADGSVPRLAGHVRLQWDSRREKWVLQAPERVIYPDEIALAILNRCDGTRTLEAIVGELAAEYDAPAQTVRGDVVDLLQDLADKGVIVDGPA